MLMSYQDDQLYRQDALYNVVKFLLGTSPDYWLKLSVESYHKFISIRYCSSKQQVQGLKNIISILRKGNIPSSEDLDNMPIRFLHKDTPLGQYLRDTCMAGPDIAGIMGQRITFSRNGIPYVTISVCSGFDSTGAASCGGGGSEHIITSGVLSKNRAEKYISQLAKMILDWSG